MIHLTHSSPSLPHINRNTGSSSVMPTFALPREVAEEEEKEMQGEVVWGEDDWDEEESEEEEEEDGE